MTRSALVWDALRGLLLDNLLYKVVAFLFALTIWAWVQSEQVVDDRFRVPIRWKLPEGLTTAEVPLDSATLTLEGVQAYVRSVRQKELAVTVDLSSASEGAVNVDLAAVPVEGLPEQVRITAITPATLQIQLDRVLKRRVPVRVPTRGEPARGFVVKHIQVTPERVELMGPAAAIRDLEEVNTDPVDLSALRETSEFPVALALKKGQISLVRPTPVNVTVEVMAVVEERRFEAVPVMIRSGEAWVASAEVATVTLTGPNGSLAEIAADSLSVLVYLPEGFSGEGDARLGGSGLHFDVVHPGGDEVRVTLVQPEVIHVKARVP